MTDADAAYPGGITSNDKRSRWARRRPDRVRSDLRIARSRRQIVMTEQNLNDPDVGSAFQEMRRRNYGGRVCNVIFRLVSPAALTA